MSQNEPRDEKPGKAQTMAEALHDVGVNTVVSASGNGVLIRVHDRFTPRLLELLRAADGTEPVAPGDEAVKTEAPPEPDDPRRWTKWERPLDPPGMLDRLRADDGTASARDGGRAAADQQAVPADVRSVVVPADRRHVRRRDRDVRGGAQAQGHADRVPALDALGCAGRFWWSDRNTGSERRRG
jgi:hypothetical protein